MPSDFHADVSALQYKPIACIVGGKVIRLSSNMILVLEAPCKIEFAGQVRLTMIDEARQTVKDEPEREEEEKHG